MKSVNPATGERIAEYDEMNAEEIDRIIRNAAEEQKSWSKTSFSDRAVVLEKTAELLRGDSEALARLMAEEMGKPLPQGISEIEKCAWVCEYYAENAAQFLEDEPVETDASRSYVTFRPTGMILAIMPWNFPFWQLFRFAAPALMAGNGGLLKHASNVTGCALEIESVLHRAGLPENLFRTLVAGADKMEDVIAHDGIAAVTLTGSTGAGKAVAKQAGSHLKKSVLELGGSDPYLVLHDADLEQAVETCVASRLLNGGQSCIAAKRFIVAGEVFEPFRDRFVELMSEKKMGDPFDGAADLGPMATADLRDELHRQVRESVHAGAECHLGGEIPDRPGAWYPPTVLSGVEPGMPAYHEELFGPAASLIRADSEEDAIRIANDTGFGLGAAVFSEDLNRAEQIAADRLHAGCCFVNAYVKSDPRLPFGGVKQSGYGRELSHYGIKEFVNIKTIYRS